MGKNKRRRPPREASANDPSSSRPERTFQLKWASVGTTRQDFVATNCSLSMLCSQLEGDVLLDHEDGEQDPDTGPAAAEDGSDFGGNEAVEMWESDDKMIDDQKQQQQQHDKQKSTLAEAALKSRFLDRLAEVLARVKKPPQAVKQVATAYMAEMDHGDDDDDGSQRRVEIRLAKNEGLSGEDEGYLRMLFGALRQVARGGMVADTPRA